MKPKSKAREIIIFRHMCLQFVLLLRNLTAFLNSSPIVITHFCLWISEALCLYHEFNGTRIYVSEINIAFDFPVEITDKWCQL